MEAVKSREWVLTSYVPEGTPTMEHMKLRSCEVSVDSVPDGHVAIQTLYLSVDPYLRTRMTGLEDGLYLSQFPLNQVITAFGIGRVIKSLSGDFREGDVVTNPFSPVAEYYTTSCNFLRKVDPAAGIDLPCYLSALGVPGFAAWIGIQVLANPKPGENVFISAAAGGVGMFAGQLAKLKGCRVVGSTGSDDKVKLLKEEFGYDDAFNYKKESDLDAALTRYFPSGIDIYLDNVGGKMLEAVLNRVNVHARIPVCGMISQYNKAWSDREGVRNLLNMVGKEVRMEGYLVGSYLDRLGDFMKEMEGHLKQGSITSKHKIYKGMESFPESLGSLFSSSNDGKVIVQL
uniref:Enoyl reductase (ER) domain-containing protein n=1 Tax=Kalanchoe fedtschenkoi TaxID=63787 RepID=A0A7N0TGB5_KALFE